MNGPHVQARVRVRADRLRETIRHPFPLTILALQFKITIAAKPGRNSPRFADGRSSSGEQTFVAPPLIVEFNVDESVRTIGSL